jgi:hypothetical protein
VLLLLKACCTRLGDRSDQRRIRHAAAHIYAYIITYFWFHGARAS